MLRCAALWNPIHVETFRALAAKCGGEAIRQILMLISSVTSLIVIQKGHALWVVYSSS